MIAIEQIYKDEKVNKEEGIQKRKIVETETFQVAERIKIIRGIITIMEKEAVKNA